VLESGSSAGHDSPPRDVGFQRVIVEDCSRSQWQHLYAWLGSPNYHVFAAADVYCLPFINGAFDAAMMRTLSHMGHTPQAQTLAQCALSADTTFVLEFANKRNLKAILLTFPHNIAFIKQRLAKLD
jgi:hypothetical protein